MTDTKWTPGPWRDGCGPDGKPLIFATSNAFPRVDADYEHRANMHLLDSAPRLYEALAFFVGLCEESSGVAGFHLNGDIADWGEFQDEIDNAEAALAAARGEK